MECLTLLRSYCHFSSKNKIKSDYPGFPENTTTTRLIKLLVDYKIAKTFTEAEKAVETWRRENEQIEKETRERLPDYITDTTSEYSPEVRYILANIGKYAEVGLDGSPFFYSNCMKSFAPIRDRMKEFSKTLPKDLKLDTNSSVFSDALEYACEIKAADLTETIKKLIEFNPGKKILARRLIKDIVRNWRGREDIADELVLEQWIWQVKRRLHGMTVPDVIAFFLVGAAQGTGKTQSLRRLISPLPQSAEKAINAEKLSDNRWDQITSGVLFLTLEELAGMGKSDIDSIKASMTAEFADVRIMRTTKSVKLRRLSSIFGSSNKQISEVIKDNGMRRFYQIDIFEKFDLQWFLDTDFLPLWEGIDENDVQPFWRDSTTHDEIKRRQSKWATPTFTQAFVRSLSEQQIEEAVATDGREVSDLDGTGKDTIYSMFLMWIKDETGSKTRAPARRDLMREVTLAHTEALSAKARSTDKLDF